MTASSLSGPEDEVENCECTIVVPCYNEASRLPGEQFLRFTASRPRIKFLFVNDGSKDATASVLRSLVEKMGDRGRLLDLARNGGKSEAVRQGMLEAFRGGAQRAGFWDADLATPLEDIENFQTILDRRPERLMVFGARVKLLGREVERLAIRHYLGRIFATVVSTMLRLPIYDTQCGAKLFRRTADVESLFVEPFLSRWVFDVEILARLKRRWGMDAKRVAGSIYEYPLEQWKDVRGSKVASGDFVKAFLDVARIWRRYLS